MRGRIPEDVVDKIREDTAIEGVVGHFLTLIPKGNSLWACCPFHSEKTPSFHVNVDRQIYYCFGCQRGGNVFRFLMEKEGMTFPEALEWCAERLGIDLQRISGQEDEGPNPREGILSANRWAEEWFAEQLAGPGGQEARAYARGRGLAPETIEAFGLGWAPAESDRLPRSAKEAKVDPEGLRGGSLVRQKDGRAEFAYFRSRLIFPIRGVAQKVYGFGGRILGPGEPKYLNTPETSVFRKRQTLYALPEARSSLKRSGRAILVEGYLDALALHQAGWTQTVATCGTAFTSEQARQLQRWVKEVVLVFDGDGAGRKAAYRSAGIALAEGLDVRIVRLPEGQDPADLLVAGEVEAVRTALQEAPGLVQCLRAEVSDHGNGRVVRERALNYVRDLAAGLHDQLRAELLLDEAAREFGVSPQALRATRANAPRPRPRSDEDASTTNPDSTEDHPTERRLLALACLSRRARRHLLDHRGRGDWTVAAHAALADALGQVDPGVDGIGGIHALGLEGTELESVAAGILTETSDADREGLDPTAEIDAILEAEKKQNERVQSRRTREGLDEAYRQGGDEWMERLRRRQADLDDSNNDPDPS